MKKLFFVLLMGLLFFQFACQSEAAEKAAEEARMNAETEKRIAEYITVLQENCRKRAIDQAIIVADSLIIQDARLRGDTLFKPTRPEKPETQILIDTTPVKPFLKPRRDTTIKLKH